MIFLAAPDKDRKEKLLTESNKLFNRDELIEVGVSFEELINYQGDKPSVLIVEDQIDPLLRIAQMLSQQFTCVLSWSDCSDFHVNVFRAIHPQACTIDLNLGSEINPRETAVTNTSGFKVIREIQEEDPYIAPVIVSNYAKNSKIAENITLEIKRCESRCFYYVEKFSDDFRRLAEIIADSIGTRKLGKDYQLPPDKIGMLIKDVIAPSPSEAQKSEASSELKQLIGDLDLGDFLFDPNIPQMYEVMKNVVQIIKTEPQVLIHGETGIGKTLLSQVIHKNSSRKDKPFVKFIPSEHPETLIEDRLFGHERGSYTSATTMTHGFLEKADRGILFIDEVQDIPLEVQAKLLRVLNDKEFERIGSTETIKIDVWIILASNIDPKKLIDENKLRPDFYYRISNGVISQLPPLREMKGIIPNLVNKFLSKKVRITQAAISKIMAFDWPGNIRELKGVLEDAASSCYPENIIDVEHISKALQSRGTSFDKRKQSESEETSTIRHFFQQACPRFKKDPEVVFLKWRKITTYIGNDESIHEWKKYLGAVSPTGEKAYEYCFKLLNSEYEKKTLQNIEEDIKNKLQTDKKKITREEREEIKRFVGGVALYAIIASGLTKNVGEIGKKFFAYKVAHGFTGWLERNTGFNLETWKELYSS